ncbi:MAG: hypothetical protein WAT92_03025 [Saprospiraceae bacterium]
MIKDRILTGWNFTRVAYTLVGLYIVLQAFTDKQWSFLPLGLYFASMGVFAFGCAGGNCYVPKTGTTTEGEVAVSFEEVNKK